MLRAVVKQVDLLLLLMCLLTGYGHHTQLLCNSSMASAQSDSSDRPQQPCWRKAQQLVTKVITDYANRADRTDQ
jgi:hypothetical protein